MLGFGKNKEKKDTTPAEKTEQIIEENKEAEAEIPPITWRELKALKRSKYHLIKDNFKTTYTLFNKKTGQIVEINAGSDFHASNIIGWRYRNVEVLDSKEIVKPEVEAPVEPEVPAEAPEVPEIPEADVKDEKAEKQTESV